MYLVYKLCSGMCCQLGENTQLDPTSNYHLLPEPEEHWSMNLLLILTPPSLWVLLHWMRMQCYLMLFDFLSSHLLFWFYSHHLLLLIFRYIEPQNVCNELWAFPDQFPAFGSLAINLPRLRGGSHISWRVIHDFVPWKKGELGKTAGFGTVKNAYIFTLQWWQTHIFVYFQPKKPLENDPTWLIFFQRGWKLSTTYLHQ